MKYKIPVSVLVVVYTPDMRVLLMERADRSGFWQSVTGSQEAGETLEQTAERELEEETGILANRYRLEDWQMSNEFEIYKRWSGRYAPGVTHNTEHVFGLEVPYAVPIRLSPREHLGFEWLAVDQAIDKVFSWTNAAALRRLAERGTAIK